ncbi:zinc ribbon domain-containing protein [Actinoplanes sp. NPDC026619]|uniref:Zn-ribbon domain-containing OB-fold protein n=1 Tax=Actinoplanes sp. NPDC026619 TaxID=3155798 RepID=UPI0033DD46E4
MPSPLPDLADDAAYVTDTPGGVALVGSRCRDCAAAAFPARAVCYRCGGDAVERGPVGTAGRVYASTTVHVSSVRPTPYHLAYVDLDGDLRVLGRVDTATAPGDVVRVTGAGRDWSFAR